MHARLGIGEKTAGHKESDQRDLRIDASYNTRNINEQTRTCASRQRTDQINLAVPKLLDFGFILETLELGRVSDLLNCCRTLDPSKSIGDGLADTGFRTGIVVIQSQPTIGAILTGAI